MNRRELIAILVGLPTLGKVHASEETPEIQEYDDHLEGTDDEVEFCIGITKTGRLVKVPIARY